MKTLWKRMSDHGDGRTRRRASWVLVALVTLVASCGGGGSGELDGLKVTDLSLASGGEAVRVAFGMAARDCDYDIGGPSSAVISGYVVNSSSSICPSGESWEFEWDKLVLTTPDGDTVASNPGETVTVAVGEEHIVAETFELDSPDSGRYVIAYDGTEVKSADL